ncbi:hypothetical protein [Rufibacter tibetensis]|uniref:hypothetical protein n=1 Tax=Rufibacter tibetensis TaxID=512763 RepID=UPI0012FBFC19|nr:hypothetical protein [Rufibacter tibetensis]
MGKSKNRLDLVGLGKKDYFDGVNYVRTVAGLRNVLTKPKQLSTNTSREVTFKGLCFGATIKEAKRLLGKPEFHVRQDQDVVGHEVLFYFSYVGSVKVTQCLHFLYGKFIMGQSIVKTPKPAKSKAIIESVLSGYNLMPENEEAAMGVLFPVCDGSFNRIEIHHVFDLILTYTTGDPEVLPLITKVQVQEKTRSSLLRRALPEQVVRYV